MIFYFFFPKGLAKYADKASTGRIMNTQSFYTRQMLLQYGRQLVAARRLARYDHLTGRPSPVGTEAARVKRRAMIERIAREIMENLIFSGSENPIVQEVREALARELGERFTFRYPPADLGLQIFRSGQDEGEREVTGEEKQAIMSRLWDVTLRTVDASML